MLRRWHRSRGEGSLRLWLALGTTVRKPCNPDADDIVVKRVSLLSQFPSHCAVILYLANRPVFPLPASLPLPYCAQ